VPLGLSYFHPGGFLAALGVTYIHQHVAEPPESPFPQGDEGFVTVNASIGYRFPRRRGLVSLEVRNLFDADFRYLDDSFARGQNEYIEQPNFSTPFIPDRVILARLTLNF
jgi:outer membrane receptor protein involved in Fe transport